MFVKDMCVYVSPTCGCQRVRQDDGDGALLVQGGHESANQLRAQLLPVPPVHEHQHGATCKTGGAKHDIFNKYMYTMGPQ